eukprot:COSAG05_NODE_3063_length_2366_cov_73.625152_1_plen_750_part_10
MAEVVQEIKTGAGEEAPTKGPGATYYTPMHKNGVKDTSANLKLGPKLAFNPVVTAGSIIMIMAFMFWCMLHTACNEQDFAGTCSFKADDNSDKEDCDRFGSGATIAWNNGTDAVCSNTTFTDEGTCNDACSDCDSYYPSDGASTKQCPCPCPKWNEEVKAGCKVSGITGAADATELIEGFDQATCNELIANRAIWTPEADAGYEVPLYFDGKVVTGDAAKAATDATACAEVGGYWKVTTARAEATLTGQAAITESTECLNVIKNTCKPRNSGWDTEDKLDVDQDWDAKAEFGSWKAWIAKTFSWLYIGSQDLWIVFIIVVYFSKYSDIKLCPKDEEDKPPEFSDASWFSMLFCSGIGVGLFYYGVAEPVWHYTGSRYASMAKTDSELAQDAMNVSYYHWGLHGFVVYTQVGLMLGIVSHRWGLPMTMKSCFYPLLGDKIFGVMGDLIDILSVITTLFGVCTSLGLGVMQLSAGLHRLTRDDDLLDATLRADSGIQDNTTTQILIIWFITFIATMSVLSGIKHGIQRLSNIAFTMGLMIMFIALYLENTWYLLNVFTQSVGYYIQWLIQLGSHTAAWETNFSPSKYNGQDLRPATSPAGTAHSTSTEDLAWMDWWTLFYWGWWIAWSPFVGTFMAKISKGRTIKQFILGSCFAPVLYGFIWFAIFGGAGIQMERVAKANTISSSAVVAIIETSTLQTHTMASGTPALSPTHVFGYTVGECAIQDQVHACETDSNCEWLYTKEPAKVTKLSA